MIVRASSGPPTRRQMAALVRRLWLRWTAPKVTRQIWKTADKRRVRICDMSNAHLLNSIHRVMRAKRETLPVRLLHPRYMDLFDALIVEARRRKLPTIERPAWLEQRNKAFRSTEEGKILARSFPAWKNSYRGDDLPGSGPHP